MRFDDHAMTDSSFFFSLDVAINSVAAKALTFRVCKIVAGWLALAKARVTLWERLLAELGWDRMIRISRVSNIVGKVVSWI